MGASAGHTARLRLGLAVPAVGGLVAVAAVGWWTLDRACSAHSDAVAQVAVRAATETFLDLVHATTEDLEATLGSLSRDRELTAALAARDPRRLLAAAGPTFHDLRLRDGIAHWNYWEPEAAATGVRALRNVLRLGAPTLRGDTEERELLARAVREKAVVSGLELGSAAFALRAVAPVREGERLVGYVELGRDVGTLLAEMRRRTGDDFALVLDERRLDAPSWASTAARGERDGSADRSGLVVARNPTFGDTVLAAAVPPGELPDGGAALGVHREGARTFARGAFPLRDAAGVKVGAIYVLRDVTELAARERTLRRRARATLALAVLLAALGIAVAFEWLVVRPRRGGRTVAAPAGSGGPSVAGSAPLRGSGSDAD